jgi:hypothetical protein
MILTNLNRWVIVLYLRRWKEGKRVAHVSRAVPCATRTCHVYFRVENYVTCNEWRVCVCVCVEKLLHHSYCTELMFYHF